VSASAIISFVRLGRVASVLTLSRSQTTARCASKAAESSPVEAQAGPGCADVVGRAQADHRVDHDSAAERGAGQDSDRAALGEEGPAAQVQLLRADEVELAEVRLVAVAAPLEHDHAAPRPLELGGDHRDPGARADDADVRREGGARAGESLDRDRLRRLLGRERGARRPGVAERGPVRVAVIGVGQRIEERKDGSLQLAQELARLAAV
jgi:hypothetical protein